MHMHTKQGNNYQGLCLGWQQGLGQLWEQQQLGGQRRGLLLLHPLVMLLKTHVQVLLACMKLGTRLKNTT